MKLQNCIIKVTRVSERVTVKNGVTIPYALHKAIIQDGRAVSFMSGRTMWLGFWAIDATLEKHPKWGLQLKRVKVKDSAPDKSAILASGIMEFVKQG